MMFIDKEPHGVFFLIDNKSFYASCEAVQRGFNPLKIPLVVLSEQENTNGGLILATSPEAKRLFHLKANVSRQRNLPQDPRLCVVPPRMNLYIKRNLQINQIFTEFASEQDVWPYSIDESIVDMTHSWKLFGDTPREVARVIQKTVRKRLGLYTTVGIGDNPVQAKIALDVYAKHTPELIGEIHYETVPKTIWPINNLTDVWGIGKRTAKHLNRLGIHNMYQLAHTNPYLLKKKWVLLVNNYLRRHGALTVPKSAISRLLSPPAWVTPKYCLVTTSVSRKSKRSLKKSVNRLPLVCVTITNLQVVYHSASASHMRQLQKTVAAAFIMH
ncbi:DNA polymerase IV [Lentilactobacillus hilgardii]|nr:ImpB/MucB/SamB family protein [Lentilactobacillus buchneri ATCC 11577]QIR08651.1 DNA polymerase IV [Lentilactobacillus hilgardii]